MNTSPTVHIRPATIADESVLVSLATRLTAFELPPWRRPEDIAVADAREMMEAVRTASASNEVIVAEREGVAVGCLHVLETKDFFGTAHAHVSVIATALEAEGTGVGRVLLDYAEQWARKRGHTLITLHVFAANGRARRFYERAGWSPEILKYSKPLTAPRDVT